MIFPHMNHDIPRCTSEHHSDTLFDDCILPFLTYGAEVWAAFERFDSNTREKCPLEQVHLRFCKHLLAVNRSAMNSLCRPELGRRSIKFITDLLKVINFYKHCRSLPTHDLSCIALDQDCTIFSKNSTMDLFLRFLRDLETMFSDNFTSKGKHQQKFLFPHIMIRFGNQN